MKKLLFILLVAFMLSAAGLVQAANIPGAIDPKAGPEVWITTVYNDDTDFDIGDCVEWKIDNSTGDNDNYVEQCDSSGTGIVAGIVYPAAIAAGDSGSIAIWGVVSVDVVTTGANSNIAAGSILCSSTTNGSLETCPTLDKEKFAVGHAVATASSGTVNAFINP